MTLVRAHRNASPPNIFLEFSCSTSVLRRESGGFLHVGVADADAGCPKANPSEYAPERYCPRCSRCCRGKETLDLDKLLTRSNYIKGFWPVSCRIPVLQLTDSDRSKSPLLVSRCSVNLNILGFSRPRADNLWVSGAWSVESPIPAVLPALTR